MRLSKASMYAALALRHLIDIQSDGSQPVQARHVAEHLGIPTDSALKVLQSLSRGGLLQSTLGRRGGYRPAAGAAEATLLRIVELMDGPIVAEVPLDGDTPVANSLWQVCRDVRDRTAEQLASVRITDLAPASADQPGPDGTPQPTQAPTPDIQVVDSATTPPPPTGSHLALAG
ncbi:MAG: Rrf2 family transcriptional regulator [Planctomycetota bacterium]